MKLASKKKKPTIQEESTVDVIGFSSRRFYAMVASFSPL
jgi:hypothetical protein